MWSNEENWPLHRALQAHLIRSVTLQVCWCVGVTAAAPGSRLGETRSECDVRKLM